MKKKEYVVEWCERHQATVSVDEELSKEEYPDLAILDIAAACKDTLLAVEGLEILEADND